MEKELGNLALNFSVITLSKEVKDGKTEVNIIGADEGFKALFGGQPAAYLNKPLNSLFTAAYRDFGDLLLHYLGQKHMLEAQHLETHEKFLVEISLSEIPTGHGTNLMLGIIQKAAFDAPAYVPFPKRKSFYVSEEDRETSMFSKCRRLSLSGRRLSFPTLEGDKYNQDEEEEEDIMIGPYCIGTPIAINEKNRVHLAHHTKTNEVVVVKMCAHTNDSSNQHRLRLEYDIGSKLDHPNISKYLDFIETKNDMCIFVEYCGSETLEAVLKNTKYIEESQARHYFMQLISALKYCHERRVYHGDIKLSNILVYNGDIKLIDFDASKANTSERTTFCGTIAFMSPEIILHTSYNGEASDIWSAGVCLYVMISGTYPFNSLAETLDGKYSSPANASVLCSNLLESILQVNPELRPSPSTILTHPWITSHHRTANTLINLQN